MFSDLKRNYKSVGTGETVSRITKILENVGLDTKPVDTFNPYEGISSLSIYLENLGITSRGKGINKDYATASGYAEFIERTQNDAYKFFGAERLSKYDKVFEKFGYMFYPDEKEITQYEFDSTIKDIAENNFKLDQNKKENFEMAAMFYRNRIRKNSFESKAVPFFDTKNQRYVYIPLHFIYNVSATNGMCAGNTAEEALSQGFFEIIERYASRKMFFEKLTPPDIPSEVLSECTEQINLINKIQETENIEVKVKDFSCGIGLPAVGIILIDHASNTYHVHCAGETSLSVALHRCLTETYQNLNSAKIRLIHQIPQKEYEYMDKQDDDSVFLKNKNWLDWMKWGGGAFAGSVLNSTPSYAFDKNAFRSQSNYKLELDSLIKYIWKLGFNVYIRDNSFLGFPSYMIYIPHISHEAEDYFGALTYYSRQKFLNVGLILLEQKPNDLKMLLHELEMQPEDQSLLFHYYYGQIRTLKASPWVEDNTSFLLAMIYLYNNEYKKCLNLITGLKQKYINNELNVFATGLKKSDMCFYDLLPDKTEQFFELIIDFVNDLIAGKTEGINSFLDGKGYDSEVINKADKLFADKNEMLRQINMLPVCPRCDDCKIYDICGTKNSMDILEKVFEKHEKSNLIDVKSLLIKDSH